METKPGDLEGLAETSSKAIQKESEAAAAPKTEYKDPAPAASAPIQQDVASTEEVPDPDEDDLDDLDGMLSPQSVKMKYC